jgi:hypothetical protein
LRHLRRRKSGQRRGCRIAGVQTEGAGQRHRHSSESSCFVLCRACKQALDNRKKPIGPLEPPPDIVPHGG